MLALNIHNGVSCMSESLLMVQQTSFLEAVQAVLKGFAKKNREVIRSVTIGIARAWNKQKKPSDGAQFDIEQLKENIGSHLDNFVIPVDKLDVFIMDIQSLHFIVASWILGSCSKLEFAVLRSYIAENLYENVVPCKESGSPNEFLVDSNEIEIKSN